MVAILVMNPLYFQKLNMSDATVAEVHGYVTPGEVLYDPVSKRKYEVVSRGFAPTVGDATKDRLIWSREVAIGLRGRCDEIDGRMLVDESACELTWLRISCRIESKAESLPVEVPIVGTIQSDSDAFAALALVHRDATVDLLTAGESLPTDATRSIVFNCQTPKGATAAVHLRKLQVEPLATEGKLVEWDNEDAPCEII